MSAKKLLILENSLGQKVRTFAVDADSLNLIYRKDTRRVEAFADLSELDENNIEYTLLQKIKISQLSELGLDLQGMGRLRLYPVDVVKNSPTHSLPAEQDDEKLKTILHKTAASHIVAVFVLILGSWVWMNYFTKTQEPPLVTITLPPPPVVEAVKSKT